MAINDLYAAVTDLYEKYDDGDIQGDDVRDLRSACTDFLKATDGNEALLSLLGSLMSQDAGMLEVTIERAHKVLGIEEDAKDTDSVLKLFGYDRNAD
jgi:hypothetical protein